MKRFRVAIFVGLSYLLVLGHQQALGAEKYTKSTSDGVTFEYPADWRSFRQDVVAGMKSSMAGELRKYNRTLRVLQMYISQNEEVAFFFSSIDPEPSITAQSVLAERKKVHEDAMAAHDVTKVNALVEETVNKCPSVREDVERSNGGRGCTVKVLANRKLLEFSLIVNNKANFDKYKGELDYILSSLSAQSAPPAGAGRTVGTLRFTVPANWTALSESDLRDARREYEGLIKPSYAGPVTLESFEYFLLPDNSGMFVTWTVRIAEQKDFLSTLKERETGHLEAFRRQGQVKIGSCEIVKVSGGDVVKVDIDRVNGAKSVNLHHWSPDAPGVITVLQLGLRPNRSAKAEADAKAMFDSVAVVSKKDR